MKADQWAVLAGGVAAIGGIFRYFFGAPRSAVVASSTSSGVQESRITVRGGYSPAEIQVEAGRPVRLVFDRQESNPCSEELVIPDLQIRRFLTPHATTTVEFTPSTPGSFDFHCGMGMLHGRLVVK